MSSYHLSFPHSYPQWVPIMCLWLFLWIFLFSSATVHWIHSTTNFLVTLHLQLWGLRIWCLRQSCHHQLDLQSSLPSRLGRPPLPWHLLPRVCQGAIGCEGEVSAPRASSSRLPALQLSESEEPWLPASYSAKRHTLHRDDEPVLWIPQSMDVPRLHRAVVFEDSTSWPFQLFHLLRDDDEVMTMQCDSSMLQNLLEQCWSFVVGLITSTWFQTLVGSMQLDIFPTESDAWWMIY